MEEISLEHRNAKMVKRQVLDMLISLGCLLYLLACDMIPELLNTTGKPTRNPNCKMQMQKWNFLYGMCFLVPSILGNSLFWLGYKYHLFRESHPVIIFEWLKKSLIFLMVGGALLTMIGYTTWFIFAVKSWKLNSEACTQGWNQLDMFNFMFLTAFTGWPASVTIVFTLVCFVFSPCIYTYLQDYWNNLR